MRPLRARRPTRTHRRWHLLSTPKAHLSPPDLHPSTSKEGRGSEPNPKQTRRHRGISSGRSALRKRARSRRLSFFSWPRTRQHVPPSRPRRRTPRRTPPRRANLSLASPFSTCPTHLGVPHHVQLQAAPSPASATRAGTRSCHRRNCLHLSPTPHALPTPSNTPASQDRRSAFARGLANLKTMTKHPASPGFTPPSKSNSFLARHGRRGYRDQTKLSCNFRNLTSRCSGRVEATDPWCEGPIPLHSNSSASSPSTPRLYLPLSLVR